MSLRIAYLTAGGAGMFCGSCMRDNTLAAALHRQGVDAQLIPLYTPIRTDEAEVTIDRVFYGGINVYLQQNYPWLAAIPGLGALCDWLLDQPWLIQWATGFGIETNAAALGEITISVLQGEDGRLKHEADKLCDWLAKEVRPDLVNLSNILIGGCVPELKRKLQVPIVVTLQGDDIFLRDLTEPYKTKAFERIRALVDEIDSFIVFSRYYAEFMQGYFGIPAAKIHTVTMGIDTRDFASIDGSKEPRSDAEKGPVIGYLARLAPEKGLHVLVDAFLRLRRMPGMEKARLHIAGWLGGKNQAYADEQFRRLKEAGAGDAFHYAGTVNRKQKLDFLRGLDLLSVPTTYHEPKGLFVLEALAAGVPVVEPAHGAFPELIEATGGGWLCRPDDPQQLAEVLADALRDDAARRAKGAAGREAVHSKFHADQAARETLALYQRLLGGADRRDSAGDFFQEHHSMTRLLIFAAAQLSVAWLADGIALRAAEAERPNFVVIIADDLSPEDLGCYGNKGIRTPNIDKIASAGLRFDNAFLTCSSCSPSRSSIMTGRYPHQTGASELHQPLPANQIVFPELLKAAGYFTGVAGKWHLGPNARKGFDKILGGTESGAEEWLTLLRERPKDKPFFLWLASIDPHRDYKPGTLDPPHKGANAMVPPFLPDNAETRGDLAMYYDEIGRLDKYVGDVLAELDKQKLAENTVVVFLADNGRPFPRCKTTVYDSGIRTPLLVRWPGKVAAGETRKQLVSSIDLSATILDLAGLKQGPTFQGESFAKILSDANASGRDAIFSEHNWHDYQAHERAIRSDRYLYIRNAFPQLTCSPPADAVRSPTYQKMIELEAAGALSPDHRGCFVVPRAEEELYDVVSDPHQLKNLIGDPKLGQRLSDLRSRLDAWIKQTGDKVPEKPTPDKYDRKTGKLPTP